jgi:hypothetical protein
MHIWILEDATESGIVIVFKAYFRKCDAVKDKRNIIKARFDWFGQKIKLRIRKYVPVDDNS